MKAVFTALVSFFFSCALAQGVFTVRSPEFKNKGIIPKKFTCQGDNVSPALIIEHIPAGAKSLALIVDDPDAPGGAWVHWVVFNIPPTGKIPEGAVSGVEGNNDFGKTSYGGPCPPQGTHRYYFKLYALDSMLPRPERVRKKDLEKAMEGHILQEAVLMGLYKKN